MKVRLSVLLLCFATLFPPQAGAWGGQVHHLINRSAVACLPAEFSGFSQWAGTLERLATAADERKSSVSGEDIRHYINIDDYPEFFAGTFPHVYQTAIARYGVTRVEDNGIVPWAIDDSYQGLVVAFRAHNWTRAVELAADIGHYVGDIHNPLHDTQNYNGQLSGQSGVHSRFESEMTDRYSSQLTPSPRPAPALGNVVETVFDWIDGLYPGVAIILAADLTAKAAAGGSTRSDAYYEALWEEVGQDADYWISEASVHVASVWYTAWVEAGSPVLPGTSPVRATTVGRLKARWGVLVP